MSKKEEEKGSFVNPKEPSEPVPLDEATVKAKMLNAVELVAKVLSGIGTTLVTVKVAIDENTKQQKETEEKLNSVLTLLVVGKDEQKKTSPVKPESSPTSANKPELPPQPTPQSEQQKIEDKTSEIRMAFPEDLETMLNFEDKGDYVMIKPKQFLGSENFAKIASAVRGMGGEYVSAGRDSHFKVFKQNGK